MTKISLQLDNISFCYSGANTQLFDRLTLHFSSGWTGVVGANGAGKSTILKLAVGMLEADNGNIIRPSSCLYCEQRTDEPPPNFSAFLEAADPEACTMKGLLKIEESWFSRWQTLSHGERKRAQIATALWLAPDVIALDEPTNHLDSDARDMLASALKRFQGAGLLVSHDRQLLDLLCFQCLFLEHGSATMRPGGISEGLAIRKNEQESLKKKRGLLKRAQKNAARQLVEAKEESARSAGRMSKKGISRRDSDARGRIDAARLTGKDARAGAFARQSRQRLELLTNEVADLYVHKEAPGSIWFDLDLPIRRDRLVYLEEGSIALGEKELLSFPTLTMKSAEKLALVGPNGSGKSSLIRHIIEREAVSHERLLYLPQEISCEESVALLNEARKLTGNALGRLMTVVARLGSEPEQLLTSETPSPGELRKLLLALGLQSSPELIIMDEPTNHLDLLSIEALSTALSQCPVALLLVSHDEAFLSATTERRWRIRRLGAGQLQLSSEI